MPLASPAPAPLATPPGASIDADLSGADAAAEALLAQSRSSGSPTKVEVSPERSDALDKAFEEATGTQPPPGALAEGEIGRDNAGVKRKLEGAPTDAEEKAAADAQKLADEKQAADEKVAADKKVAESIDDPLKSPDAKRRGLLGDVLDDKKPDVKPTDDIAKAYEEIKLRPDASDKTKESFNNQRALAIQRETAVKEQLDAEKKRSLDLESRVTELEKGKGVLPEETAAELKELREFRAVHDVTARPEFREKFDSRISANEASIYEFFKKEGMPDDRIAALKSLTADARDEYLEKHVYPKLTSGHRRFIESKLVENVTISGEKEKALAAARAESDKILSEQREAPKKQQEARTNAIAKQLTVYLPQMPYIHDMEAQAGATDVEKKAIDEHNKFAAELRDNLRQAVLDDTPETRAEIAVAVPAARWLARQIKAVSAERDALKAKLDAIDRASATGGRLGRSASPAPTGPAAPPAAKTSDDSGDVIDKLFAANQGR